MKHKFILVIAFCLSSIGMFAMGRQTVMNDLRSCLNKTEYLDKGGCTMSCFEDIRVGRNVIGRIYE